MSMGICVASSTIHDSDITGPCPYRMGDDRMEE